MVYFRPLARPRMVRLGASRGAVSRGPTTLLLKKPDFRYGAVRFIGRFYRPLGPPTSVSILKAVLYSRQTRGVKFHANGWFVRGECTKSGVLDPVRCLL